MYVLKISILYFHIYIKTCIIVYPNFDHFTNYNNNNWNKAIRSSAQISTLHQTKA